MKNVILRVALTNQFKYFINYIDQDAFRKI